MQIYEEQMFSDATDLVIKVEFKHNGIDDNKILPDD